MMKAIRRFVSHLTGRNNVIFFSIIILVCIVALSLGIYVQFFYQYSDTDPFMIGINIGAKKTTEEYALLKNNFHNLFTNDLKINSDDININKREEEKEIVYTAYNLVNEDETYYSVDAQIPIINIDSETIQKVNSEIKKEYYNKANSVMRQTEGNTMYKVSYKAYINSDYLSIVIKSVLKEEGKSEKVAVKTYTYSMAKEKLVTLEDLIELKETTKEIVQKSIQDEIKNAYDKAQIIANEYGTLYQRDLNSDKYKIESSNVYFLTDDGYVYILYPYGNDAYTNEIDIVIF